eukprot:COSAG06_NODE_32_length_31260_cov_54.706973_28_plen_120_part_00
MSAWSLSWQERSVFIQINLPAAAEQLLLSLRLLLLLSLRLLLLLSLRELFCTIDNPSGRLSNTWYNPKNGEKWRAKEGVVVVAPAATGGGGGGCQICHQDVLEAVPAEDRLNVFCVPCA